jgi:methylated-DNA-protein-cysteine methyltransferase-like protein
MGLSSTPDHPLHEAIYALVQQIPLGQVATYGQIATLLGRPRYARQVGYALFRVAPERQIPWQRVVNAKGMVSRSPLRHGSDDLQRLLLEQEGIEFDAQDRLDLRQYQWHPHLLHLAASIGLMPEGTHAGT